MRSHGTATARARCQRCPCESCTTPAWRAVARAHVAPMLMPSPDKPRPADLLWCPSFCSPTACSDSAAPPLTQTRPAPPPEQCCARQPHLRPDWCPCFAGRGASSDVDVTGLCDAVGVDMADVADAMLAGAAAQMPRLDAGSAGGDELPAVDSPCAADGSGKGNSTSTTYRCVSPVPREA